MFNTNLIKQIIDVNMDLKELGRRVNGKVEQVYRLQREGRTTTNNRRGIMITEDLYTFKIERLDIHIEKTLLIGLE